MIRPAKIAGAGVLVSLFVFASACAHSTKIESLPEGATVFVDGEEAGKAPIDIESSAGFFDERQLRVEKEGYSALETTLVQTDPIWWVVVPALCGAPFSLGTSCLLLGWSTRFAEAYTYRLSPVMGDGERPPSADERDAAKDRDENAVIPY